MILKDDILVDNFVIRIIDPKTFNFCAYLDWMNSFRENMFIESISDGWNLQKLQNYVRISNESDNTLLLAILEVSSLVHVGNLKFGPIDFIQGTSWVGTIIGNLDFRGKGLFRKCFLASAQKLYQELNISDFYLGVNQKNENAIRSYLKTGFSIIDSDDEIFKMWLNISKIK